MEINGISFNLLDIPAELTEEYNRWYDLDHIAEHISKADVLMGRRYVRPAAYRELDGIQISDFLDGYPPYLTIYSFGGPLDMDSVEARQLWTDVDQVIKRQGRFWKDGYPRHGSRWRLEQATGRPSVHVVPRAIPYMAHKGLIVAIGRAPSADTVQPAIDWWNGTHLPDLFTVPGVLAAVRYRSTDPAAQDLVMHTILCEDDPGEVIGRIEESRRYTIAIGRYPAYGGRYESLAWLPYRTIVPLDYGFDIGPTDRT
ncbi:MAG: hypothetical protein AB7L13_20615 [Acidimicrobiia bacterium]